MIKIQNSLRGFTLIETLIFITLTSIIIGSSLVIVYQIIESNNVVSNKILVEQEVDFLFQKIKWVLIGVVNINNPSIGLTSPTLSVNKVNSNQNPFIFNLELSGVWLKRGLDSSVILNSQNVTITNLSFEYLPANAGAFEAIKVNLTANGKNFTNIIYLRK